VVEGNAQDAIASGRIPPEARSTSAAMARPILLNKRVIVTGDQMVGAQAVTDRTGLAGRRVTLNNVGGQRMFDFTSANVNKPMAVVYTERMPTVTVVDGQEVRGFKVNEEVISVANINGVFGKNFQTTGLQKRSRGPGQAAASGSLAAPMDFVEEYGRRPEPGRRERRAASRRGVLVPVHLVFFSSTTACSA
jgi:preprotein translocase subunit SecD